MKISFLKPMLLAGLAAALISGSARAEEEGIVRLGNAASRTQIGNDDQQGVIARGQSAVPQPTKPASPGLLQLLGANSEVPTTSYDASYPLSCDACCPVECDDCCPIDGGNGCGAYSDGCNGWSDGFGGWNDGHRGHNGTLLGWLGSRCGLGSNGCSSGACGYGDGYDDGFGNGRCGSSFWERQCAQYNARKRANNARLHDYLHCKLGYFIHDGCGGVGCKPFGCYSIVYPDNPAHFDGRDGQVYAAHGYGGPISVPTAPNVRHAYNYSWGVPSSRLTPISNAPY